jgi:hypothetical protein
VRVVRVFLQDYDPKKVSEVQALYRKTHLKKRLRSLGKKNTFLHLVLLKYTLWAYTLACLTSGGGVQ